MYDLWTKVSNITENMAEWGPLNKIEYKPPMSDLYPEQIQLDNTTAPKKLSFR